MDCGLNEEDEKEAQANDEFREGILLLLREHSQTGGLLQALPDLPPHVEHHSGQQDSATKTKNTSNELAQEPVPYFLQNIDNDQRSNATQQLDKTKNKN